MENKKRALVWCKALLLGYLLWGTSTAAEAHATIAPSAFISSKAETTAKPKESETNFAATPTIVIDSNMPVFNADVGKETQPPYPYYFLDGYNFPPGQKIRLTLSDITGTFLLSTTGNNDFSTLLEVEAGVDGTVDQMIFVKYAPKESGTHSVTVSHSSTGAETQTLVLQGNAVAPMPVELLYFRAEKTTHSAHLRWATASEQDNSHFEVELSEGYTNDFKKIATVESKNSNSSTLTKYSYTYFWGGVSGTLYFRLKQVDLDGTYTYSKYATLNVAGNFYPEPTIAPNPVTHASSVKIYTSEPGPLTLKIQTANGLEVHRQHSTLVAGENNIRLEGYEKLSRGMHFVTTEFEGKTYRTKLLKD